MFWWFVVQSVNERCHSTENDWLGTHSKWWSYLLSWNNLIFLKICKWCYCFEWVPNQSFSVKWHLSITDWIRIHHNIGNVYKHWVFKQFSQIYLSSTSTINNIICIFLRKLNYFSNNKCDSWWSYLLSWNNLILIHWSYLLSWNKFVKIA